MAKKCTKNYNVRAPTLFRSLNLLFSDVFVVVASLGSLNKTGRWRQLESHQIKGLKSRTIAVQVRYKSLYITLPSSAIQQREITKFLQCLRNMDDAGYVLRISIKDGSCTFYHNTMRAQYSLWSTRKPHFLQYFPMCYRNCVRWVWRC